MKRYLLTLAVSLPLLLTANKPSKQNTEEQAHNKEHEHHQYPSLWQSIVNAFKNHY